MHCMCLYCSIHLTIFIFNLWLFCNHSFFVWSISVYSLFFSHHSFQLTKSRSYKFFLPFPIWKKQKRMETFNIANFFSIFYWKQISFVCKGSLLCFCVCARAFVRYVWSDERRPLLKMYFFYVTIETRKKIWNLLKQPQQKIACKWLKTVRL